jgi:predicted nucleic acid-binding protein
VNETWVLNASPIILLGRIHRLDLIKKLSGETIVPDAVIDEIRAGQADDPTANAGLSFAEPQRAPNRLLPDSVAHWDLGAGESQVIAHALQGSHWAVLDDLSARRCAATHQIPVVGSLGIILRARHSHFAVHYR